MWAPSLARERVYNLQCNDSCSISSYIAADGLSASSSGCRVSNLDHGQILISSFDTYFLSSRWGFLTHIPHEQGDPARSQSQSDGTTDGQSVSQSVCLGVTKSKLYSDLQSVGQSVLVSCTHLGLATNFLSLWNFL
jgi:hypothetical protein